MIRHIPLACAAFVMLSALSACNTMEGLGKDVENAGDNMEDSARQERLENQNR